MYSIDLSSQRIIHWTINTNQLVWLSARSWILSLSYLSIAVTNPMVNYFSFEKWIYKIEKSLFEYNPRLFQNRWSVHSPEPFTNYKKCWKIHHRSMPWLVPTFPKWKTGIAEPNLQFYFRASLNFRELSKRSKMCSFFAKRPQYVYSFLSIFAIFIFPSI